MSHDSETNGRTDAKTFVDDRPQQATLDVGREASVTADRESRVDEGGSESFVDDRNDDSEPDAGRQDTITADVADDGQQDLTGEPAGERPEWVELLPDDSQENSEISDGSGKGTCTMADGGEKQLSQSEIKENREIGKYVEDYVGAQPEVHSHQLRQVIDSLTDQYREIRLNRDNFGPVAGALECEDVPESIRTAVLSNLRKGHHVSHARLVRAFEGGF